MTESIFTDEMMQLALDKARAEERKARVEAEKADVELETARMVQRWTSACIQKDRNPLAN